MSDWYVSKGTSELPPPPKWTPSGQYLYQRDQPSTSDSCSAPEGHCGNLQLLPFLVPSFFHNISRFYLVSLAMTASLFSSTWMHFKYLRTVTFLSLFSFIGQTPSNSFSHLVWDMLSGSFTLSLFSFRHSLLSQCLSSRMVPKHQTRQKRVSYQ